MALKVYELNGLTFQFDDQDVPSGALEVIPVTVADVPEIESVAIVPEVTEAVAEVKADVPENKAVEPDNKAVADEKPATRTKR